ncbi:MAG: hypothetical protein ACYC46_12805 [Acidobacteriaceae bacterium]
MLLTFVEQLAELSEHEPGEGALDAPSSQPQHDASFYSGVLDHFQPQLVLLSGIACSCFPSLTTTCL